MMLDKFPLKLICIIGGTLVSAVAAMLLGFVIPSKEQMEHWFQVSGYYFIFGTFGLWALSMLPAKIGATKCIRFAWKHGGALMLAVILIIGAMLSSPPRFRILADETNLAGMSASMYREHKFFNQTQGRFYYEKYHVHELSWDQRPLLFPFLVSLAHTFTGYRAENAFVVNALLGVLCLWVFYGLLQRWFSRSLAITGMVLMASFPIFVLWVTSGGFEVPNLLFVILAFFLLDTFLVTKQSIVIERLGLTLLLLAQLRYESIVLVPYFGVIVLSLMRRVEYEKLTYRFVLLPLLFLPVAWQRIINLDNEKFQVAENESVFSGSIFLNNLGKAWEFFTAEIYRYNMIPILTYLALMGLLYGIVKLVCQKKVRTKRTVVLSITGFLSFATLFVVIFSFRNTVSDIIHPAAIRYGIVFLPLLVVGSLLLLHPLVSRWRVLMRYAMVGAIGIMAWHWTVAPNNESVNHIVLYRQYGAVLKFLKQHYPDKNIIIVDERPGLYSPYFWGAVDFKYAIRHRSDLKDQIRGNLVQDILVVQKIRYSSKRPTRGTRLPSYFKLESLFEQQESHEWYISISRVVLDE